MIADAFNEPADSLEAATTRESVQGWDSMGVLMLTAEIDERFGVELSAETSRGMQSVDDILRFLRQHDLVRD